VNRAFAIILVPVLLVAAGYVVVLRAIGVTPGYGRLVAVAGVFCAGMWWLGRLPKRKRDPSLRPE